MVCVRARLGRRVTLVSGELSAMSRLARVASLSIDETGEETGLARRMYDARGVRGPLGEEGRMREVAADEVGVTTSSRREFVGV